MGTPVPDDDLPLEYRMSGNVVPDDDLPDHLKPKKKPSAGSRVQAGIAGINKGFFADLLGLPTDTVANVLDLGKASVGTAMNAFGEFAGQKFPTVRSKMIEWAPEVNLDRSGTIGTSEWLQKKYNDIGIGEGINNPNPDDELSRVLHMGGRFIGGSRNPNIKATIPLAQQASGAVKAGLAGIAAGGASEYDPRLGPLAGLLSQAGIQGISTGAPAAVRHLVRGGESGRQNMVERMQALKEGGIDEPSVGLASGNKFFQGLENIASQTPGSVGFFDTARAMNLAGMKSRTEQIRDGASREYGPAVAGNAMQSDIKKVFHDRVQKTYQLLDEKFAGKIPIDKRFPIPETLKTLDDATAINPLAPASSARRVQDRIKDTKSDIISDSSVNVPTMYGGNRTVNVGMPLSAIRDIRTGIGKEAASRAIFGTPEQADFKQVYGGLSRDMQGAAKITDLASGPQPNNIGPAQTALNRSNRFYGKAMDRADDLSATVNKQTPEAAYDSIVNSLKSGGTLYAKMRNAVTPETRSKVLATAIDEMGGATNGNQNAPGDVWSPRTFLTNYNKVYNDGGGKEMFKRLPGGEKMAKELHAVAKASEMLGDSAKVWANSSGTGSNLATRGTIGLLTFGAFMNPLLAAQTATGLGIAAGASKGLLLNPGFVSWLAKAPSVPPSQARAHAQRLMANAILSKDLMYAKDVANYLESVGEGLDDNDQQDQ